MAGIDLAIQDALFDHDERRDLGDGAWVDVRAGWFSGGHERDEALFDERSTTIDDPGDLGAVFLGPARDAGQVRLVVLAQVSGVRAGHGAVLAHPGHGHRSVETSREGDADAFADGQGFEDFRHGFKPIESGAPGSDASRPLCRAWCLSVGLRAAACAPHQA